MIFELGGANHDALITLLTKLTINYIGLPFCSRLFSVSQRIKQALKKCGIEILIIQQRKHNHIRGNLAKMSLIFVSMLCLIADLLKKLKRAWKDLLVCFYFQTSVSEMMASCDECSRVTFCQNVIIMERAFTSIVCRLWLFVITTNCQISSPAN